MALIFLPRRNRSSFLSLDCGKRLRHSGDIDHVRNLPIINQIKTWNVNSAPSNWMEIAEQRQQFSSCADDSANSALTCNTVTLIRGDISK
jgi:hypothetical protein